MCNDLNARIVIKQGAGVPTIPASSDHRNGDWIDTDIYEGEQYMDTDTGIVYTRNGSDIVPVSQSAEDSGVTKSVYTKIIDIGDWDMDSTVNVTIPHGLTLANIRNVDVNIISDTGQHYKLFNNGFGGGVIVTATDVFIGRDLGGSFDSTDFESTSFNRGYITILHV